jgi:hypothetical protein
LQKPFSLDSLARNVRRVLDEGELSAGDQDIATLSASATSRTGRP